MHVLVGADGTLDARDPTVAETSHLEDERVRSSVEKAAASDDLRIAFNICGDIHKADDCVATLC